MAGGSAIRGSRVGAGPMGEAERGEAIARFRVSYWCLNGHETKPSFAEDGTVVVPDEWDCPRCGFPAGRDKNNPPSPIKNEPYKTHLAYVKERRTEAEAKKRFWKQRSKNFAETTKTKESEQQRVTQKSRLLCSLGGIEQSDIRAQRAPRYRRALAPSQAFQNHNSCL